MDVLNQNLNSSDSLSANSNKISINNNAQINNLNVYTHPLIGIDYCYKNGVYTQHLTFHNCITVLKEYETKSLEELRYEDYLLNKKYPQNPPPTPPLLSFQQSDNCLNRIFAHPRRTAIASSSSNMSAASASSSSSSTNTKSTNEILTVSNKHKGTKLIKYKPEELTEILEHVIPFIVVETRITNIAGMKEYEKFSPEELRYLDYQNGNKYPILVAPNCSYSALFKDKKSDVKNAKNENLKNDEIIKEDVVSCPICLESIFDLKKQGNKIMSTICGHILCKPCSDNFIKKLTTKKQTFDCPTCRKALALKDIHILFI